MGLPPTSDSSCDINLRRIGSLRSLGCSIFRTDATAQRTAWLVLARRVSLPRLALNHFRTFWGLLGAAHCEQATKPLGPLLGPPVSPRLRASRPTRLQKTTACARRSCQPGDEAIGGCAPQTCSSRCPLRRCRWTWRPSLAWYSTTAIHHWLRRGQPVHQVPVRLASCPEPSSSRTPWQRLLPRAVRPSTPQPAPTRRWPSS